VPAELVELVELQALAVSAELRLPEHVVSRVLVRGQLLSIASLLHPVGR
jgi:hypothetical protein